MERRTFLQLSGLTAAEALLSGCRSKNEKLIPYLIPPDEGITPGVAAYYASSCGFCPAGCGILVRISEGRAKKIEGNPGHPINRGRLCARGQAILQELYHPDRLQQPLKRTGARGSGNFKKISWVEGLRILTSRLSGLQKEQATNSLTMLTPQLSGSLAFLIGRFMSSFGSRRHVSYELLAPDWLRMAGRKSFELTELPFYNIADTSYLLSFGADFVENHLSPVQYGNAFGRMRQGRDTVRGHFTYVGGRMSLTGASADRWMPTRPGSEGILALGIAKLIIDERLFDNAALKTHGLSPDTLRNHLKIYDLPHVAEITGLTQESIAEVAREFAGTRPSLAMVGESVAFQSNGPESVRSVQMLNMLVGNLNRPGGVYPAGTPEGPEDSYGELLELVESMHAGQIKVALIKGDPRYGIPPATGFQEALDKVPFTVSFSTLMDDTALQADLILPDHTQLESWGDVVPLAGPRQALYGLIQPVVTPLYDTRQFGDVLLAVASQLGGVMASSLNYSSYLEFVRDSVHRQSRIAKGSNFDTLWNELLRQGGNFDAQKKQSPGYRWASSAGLPVPSRPIFSGNEKQFPLHLHVYPPTSFHDGRSAPLPWLQQLPDPMTTAVWDSWVEINPATAACLGISHGDKVEVASSRGILHLPAVIYPGIRPDIVAIPLGQGHKGGGRYAKDRGVNPLTLLAVVKGSERQAAWNATKVRVTRISDMGDLVATGHSQGSYRSDLIGI